MLHVNTNWSLTSVPHHHNGVEELGRGDNMQWNLLLVF